jgi:hypothetical protein
MKSATQSIRIIFLLLSSRVEYSIVLYSTVYAFSYSICVIFIYIYIKVKKVKLSLCLTN